MWNIASFNSDNFQKQKCESKFLGKQQLKIIIFKENMMNISCNLDEAKVERLQAVPLFCNLF